MNSVAVNTVWEFIKLELIEDTETKKEVENIKSIINKEAEKNDCQ